MNTPAIHAPQPVALIQPARAAAFGRFETPGLAISRERQVSLLSLRPSVGGAEKDPIRGRRDK